MKLQDTIRRILREEVAEYARTLKNARKQGSGLRFPKSAIKANPNRFRPYSREQVDESLHKVKHFYGFLGIPNYWVDDNDKNYSDKFFNDKEYEDKIFDNFFDMDKEFGHKNSLFGTRGLEPGNPNRTSKSFNEYVERFGPMIVRILKKENIQESTKKITCKCDHSWKLSDGGNDPYTCHKCGHNNSKKYIKEEILTKSTNKEFNKYKDSMFHSLREYTFQDIVDNWDELSNHRNPNIKTIKFFVENPDEITELTYDERGLEDGYHRLIASKILNKPRVKYKMIE
jgi:hypothetical protein